MEFFMCQCIQSIVLVSFFSPKVVTILWWGGTVQYDQSSLHPIAETAPYNQRPKSVLTHLMKSLWFLLIREKKLKNSLSDLLWASAWVWVYLFQFSVEDAETMQPLGDLLINFIKRVGTIRILRYPVSSCLFHTL